MPRHNPHSPRAREIAKLRRELDRPFFPRFGMTSEQAFEAFSGQMPRRERMADVAVRVAARLVRKVAR